MYEHGHFCCIRAHLITYALTYADLRVAILGRIGVVAHTVTAAVLWGGVGTGSVPPLRSAPARYRAVTPGAPSGPLPVNWEF